MKFCHNLQFLTFFVILVAEISNKHFCKLDKILRKILAKVCIRDSLRDIWF